MTSIFLLSFFRITLVESIPENLTYPAGSVFHPSTFGSWRDLINDANYSIDIASFYWTLRGEDLNITDPSDLQVRISMINSPICIFDPSNPSEPNWLFSQEDSISLPHGMISVFFCQGETIFNLLQSAGKERGIKIRIVQRPPTVSQPNYDTERLQSVGQSSERTSLLLSSFLPPHFNPGYFLIQVLLRCAVWMSLASSTVMASSTQSSGLSTKPMCTWGAPTWTGGPSLRLVFGVDSD